MKERGIVLAYHGCDATVRDDLVAGRLPCLKPSQNPYDWLGSGIYFFEGDHRRAQLFAEAAHRRPDRQYTRQPIATPATVGALLCVNRWLDMTTQEGHDHFRSGLAKLQNAMRLASLEMPRNRPAHDQDSEVLLRHLDRSVFEMLHEFRRTDPASSIQAVRGAFYQGAPLAPSSEFREHTHIQIALTDPSCVVAWFLPPGVRLMTEGEHEAARAALDVAKQKYSSSKQRLRVAV